MVLLIRFWRMSLIPVKYLKTGWTCTTHTNTHTHTPTHTHTCTWVESTHKKKCQQEFQLFSSSSDRLTRILLLLAFNEFCHTNTNTLILCQYKYGYNYFHSPFQFGIFLIRRFPSPPPPMSLWHPVKGILSLKRSFWLLPLSLFNLFFSLLTAVAVNQLRDSSAYPECLHPALVAGF